MVQKDLDRQEAEKHGEILLPSKSLLNARTSLPSYSSYQFYFALRPSHPRGISWELNHCKRAENIPSASRIAKHSHQTHPRAANKQNSQV